MLGALLVIAMLAGAVMWWALQSTTSDGVRTVTVGGAEPLLTVWQATWSALAVGVIAVHSMVHIAFGGPRRRH